MVASLLGFFLLGLFLDSKGFFPKSFSAVIWESSFVGSSYQAGRRLTSWGPGSTGYTGRLVMGWVFLKREVASMRCVF